MSKPDLSRYAFSFVDSEYLSPEVRRELLLHLNRSPLSEEQRQDLLQFSSEVGHELSGTDVEAIAIQQEQLNEVATNARRLLGSLRKMGPSARRALEAHAEHCARSRAHPIEVPESVRRAIESAGGGLTSGCWDWVNALEVVASHAGAKLAPDRQTKPLQLVATGLVTMHACKIMELTGKAPPHSRSSWFSEYMERLGQALDLPVGPRVIANGVKQAR